jgi:hypothetical protein
MTRPTLGSSTNKGRTRKVWKVLTKRYDNCNYLPAIYLNHFRIKLNRRIAIFPTNVSNLFFVFYQDLIHL